MDEYAKRRLMWCRMSVDFMRKYNVFPIPNQIRDGGNLIQPHYGCEKDKSICPVGHKEKSLQNWAS